MASDQFPEPLYSRLRGFDSSIYCSHVATPFRPDSADVNPNTPGGTTKKKKGQ